MERLGQQLNVSDIEKRVSKMKEITREREIAELVHFPFSLLKLLEPQRGTPNSFIRSALFAAIQSKDRVFIKDATLFSQQGITIKFTGEQLNQEDMTVWLNLVHFARPHPLGNECGFTAYCFLKNMGLSTGGEQRKVLYETIQRLTACLVEISKDRKIFGASLIESFAVDEDSGSYKIRLNKELVNLFGEDDWTALNWEQRKQLRRKPLASKLHEYYSSHKNPLPVSVEFLHNLTGSNNSQLKDFKRKIKAALEALIKIDFLESYNIEDNKVTVIRKNHFVPPSYRKL